MVHFAEKIIHLRVWFCAKKGRVWPCILKYYYIWTISTKINAWKYLTRTACITVFKAHGKQRQTPGVNHLHLIRHFFGLCSHCWIIDFLRSGLDFLRSDLVCLLYFRNWLRKFATLMDVWMSYCDPLSWIMD